MSQGLFAGGTSYEHQSLNDIEEDIDRWIEYSTEEKASYEKLLSQLKKTDFYNKKVPFDYLCVITRAQKNFATNIEDLKLVRIAILDNKISRETVSLFNKIGERAFKNQQENKEVFDLRGDGYWHDYDDPDFKKVEVLYIKYAEYCSTLFDVCSAARRLEDYINSDIATSNIIIDASSNSVSVDNSISVDSSIKIGDRNRIRNSIIGKNDGSGQVKETAFSKIIWRIIVPILIGIAIAAISLGLGLK